MIHSNKSAPRAIPHEIIELVYERQQHRCWFNLDCCTGRIQGKPHHWGLHNTATNRAKYPGFVHHQANLIGCCYDCHSKRGSGDNLPQWAIDSVMAWIALGKEITMDFVESNFLLYRDSGILIYMGDRN